jgi:hypothetical protein
MLEVEVDKCAECHEVDDPALIRDEDSVADYDGDGDVTEGIAGEVATMAEALYAAMQDYANNNGGTAAIVYDSHSYPYFFTDDGNGVVDPGEAIYPNAYGTWTPNLLAAAYNYQYAAKDPGAFAHNGTYMMQVLYDSIQALGGDVSGMTRP